MTVYVIVFCAMSWSAFLNNRTTRHISFIFFLFLILFYSLRQNVGSDWYHYEYYFKNIFSAGLESSNFEIGYQILNYIGSLILNSYWQLVFFVGIFNGILFWKATNIYTKNIGIVMLLSLYYLFYPTLEAFRQSISIFLFYYSLKYIEKDPKKYLFLNIIGIFFHLTGILTLIFFVFNKFNKFKNAIILLLLVFPIIEPHFFQLISKFPRLAEKYYWYFHLEAVENSIFSLKSLEGFLILAIYFILLKKEKLLKLNEKIAVNLVLLGFILQITIGQTSNIVYRMTYYTDIGIILAITFLYDRIKQPLFKYLYIVVLIFFVFIRFYRVFPFDDPNFIYSF